MLLLDVRMCERCEAEPGRLRRPWGYLCVKCIMAMWFELCAEAFGAEVKR